MIFRDLSNISFISGNHRIYEIVQQGFYELRIDLEDFNNERRYAIYKRFYIGDESSGYRLNVEDYTGTSGITLKVKTKDSLISLLNLFLAFIFPRKWKC